MRSLIRVKERARELRQAILSSSEDLFEGLKQYILDNHELTVVSESPDLMDGAQGLLSVDEEKIFYDENLDKDHTLRLVVVAHEAGHLELHDRLKDVLKAVEPLSPYFNTGGPSLARYNRRSREEIEADAFANEFVCPSQEVFDKWLAAPEVTSVSLAKEYKISQGTMASRLAEALFEANLEIKGPAARKKIVKSDDPSQIEAAHHTGSPALVNAGPGTGKTQTLITRIEYLLEKLNASPEELLVLTFSNEAAEELRTRIEGSFGPEKAEKIEITTFHGFGHASLLGWNSELDKDYVILDESRQEEMVFALLGSEKAEPILNLRDPMETARDCVRQITKLKERRIMPDDLEESIAAWEIVDPSSSGPQRKARALLSVFRAYEQAKKEGKKTVDFPDLINLPLQVLESNSTLVEEIRKKYKWVMVDEYQDVSRSVANLLQTICGPDNPPWVVGDLRQAIYVFCGAAPENVPLFTEDFPRAKVFELNRNYRSCDEVIEAANQLAEIMNPAGVSARDIWTRASDTVRLDNEEATVRVAAANSDPSEYEGVANQVQKWLESVSGEEIAVLTRRNKDVRRVCAELSKRGIKVATPGLISTDGAAGLLACVSTFTDGEAAAVPRVVYALGAYRFEQNVIDRTIEILNEGDEDDDLRQEHQGVSILIEEIAHLKKSLHDIKFKGDAFAMMCSFLFDGSTYLRNVLGDPNETRRTMEISEILSSLSWAVAYRYSHPGVFGWKARVGFAQFFRGILSSGRPALVPPKPVEGAVQVMTCHASKGLEFPCVAVTGQTLSPVGKMLRSRTWLPPEFDPDAEDRTQADALLFVGATRAKRSLVISYAQSRKPREVPALLTAWIDKNSIRPDVWEGTASPPETISVGAVWGFPQQTKRLSVGNLAKDWCGVRVYIQDICRGRFRSLNDSPYPALVAATRRSIGRIVAAMSDGTEVDVDAGIEIFDELFPEDRLGMNPLFAYYRDRGRSYVTGFVEKAAFLPHPVEVLDPDAQFGGTLEEELLAINFGVASVFRDSTNGLHAVLFRPESMDASPGTTVLKWSNLSSDRKKLPLLVLQTLAGTLTPWVYSGRDRALYGWKFNETTPLFKNGAANAAARRRAFSSSIFDGTVSDHNCEFMCENRTNCPHWMIANTFPSEPEF